MKVAVIGAGLAGLRLARILDEQGMSVRIFDKARGPSGRLATRRSDHGQFDHGAQYFTARTPAFLRQVQDWERAGVVARWNGRIGRLEAGRFTPEDDGPKRYVGVPRMSAVARSLVGDLSTDFSHRVLAVEKKQSVWALEIEDAKPVGGFDLVVLAVPAPQAVPLLASNDGFARRAAAIPMLACHALMVRFESALDVAFDGAFVQSSDLSWVAHNASKPAREAGHTWLLHSTPEWSAANLESTPEQTRDALLGALGEACGKELPPVGFFAAHRWLYARTGRHDAGAPMWDPEQGIGVCGDWLVGDRVEDAFTSADALAAEISKR